MNSRSFYFSVCILLTMFSLTCVSTHAADVIRYIVRVGALGDTSTGSEFICDDNKKLCRTSIQIDVHGIGENLVIVSLFEPGNAFFTFYLDGVLLQADTENYFLVPLGRSGIEESSTTLFSVAPTAADKEYQSPIRPPLLRNSGDRLITLKISIGAMKIYHFDQPAVSP